MDQGTNVLGTMQTHYKKTVPANTGTPLSNLCCCWNRQIEGLGISVCLLLHARAINIYTCE